MGAFRGRDTVSSIVQGFPMSYHKGSMRVTNYKGPTLCCSIGFGFRGLGIYDRCWSFGVFTVSGFGVLGCWVAEGARGGGP